jgi:ferredoxin/flavodoxin
MEKEEFAVKPVRAIYFSPTGTTRRVLDSIIEGLGAQRVEYIDLTPVKARTHRDVGDDITLIGVPVYAGRVPVQAVDALRMIKTDAAEAVLVVVYGNRAYEDALLELKEIAAEAGFRSIAGAAFIGEHSFSTDAIPLAAGRPDKEDLAKARLFGIQVRGMARKRSAARHFPVLDLPGNSPYRDRVSIKALPESKGDLCTLCRKCEETCPQEAIAVGQEETSTDGEKCILCCACVKACPTGARRVNDARISELVGKLVVLCRDRREPDFFFLED